MLLGLGDTKKPSVLHVSKGPKGTTVRVQAGKPKVIQLPGTLQIKGKVPQMPKKKAPAAASRATVLPAAGAALLPSAQPIWARPEMKSLIGVLVLGGGLYALHATGVIKGFAGGGRRPRRVVRNPGRPRNSDPELQEAIDFRRRFHWGYPYQRISTRQVSPPPRTIVQLGKLVEVTYETRKKGERARLFSHDFEGRLPVLAMDIRNRKLHVVGGSYDVSDEGIVG